MYRLLVPAHFALAACGGVLAAVLGVPLGHLLGAMLVAAVLAVRGTGRPARSWLTRVGQATVGTGIGLQIEPSVAASIASYVGWMIGGAFFGLLVAALAAPAFARAAKIDLATAYHGLVPGGVAEMANVGASVGADRGMVALMQSSRVALTVLTVPIGLVALAGASRASGEFVSVAWTAVPLIVSAGVLGIVLGRALRIVNAWLLGPLVGTALLASAGWVDGRLPPEAIATAQTLLGYAIGTRFTRETVRRGGRVLMIGLPAFTAFSALMAFIAWLFSQLLPFDLRALVLALAIGGMAEMILTAKTLGTDPTAVTAFQVVRATIINSVGPLLWPLVRRWRS